MILGDTEEDGALWVANRILQYVENLQLPHRHSTFGHVRLVAACPA